MKALMPARTKSRTKPSAKSKKNSAKSRAAKLGAPRSHIPITPRDKLAGKWFEKLVALQARLRGPGGCPWDGEQTHESLRKFLVEETYEVLDAMDSGDPRKFSSELGDLLLQVIFHSILAEETGRFTISDVIESIHEKMIRRHPHVFGEVSAKDSAAVLKNWEAIKATERASEKAAEKSADGNAGKSDATAHLESILSAVPRSLPAVLEAYQLTRRASHVGFDWDKYSDVLDKFEEEKRELESALRSHEKSKAKRFSAAVSPASASLPAPISLNVEEEVGDLFFVAVNIARFLGVDPEIALKKSNRKFKSRFTWMESAAAKEGSRFADLPRERKEELWNEAKAHEREAAQQSEPASGPGNPQKQPNGRSQR
jgi:MazG family protein